jgi:hypothetical protein
VGQETETTSQSFSVHADLLTSRSAFFAKALRNYIKVYRGEEKDEAMHGIEQQIQWREGEEGVIKLPVDKPDVFANYVQLLYSGVLPIFDDPKKPDIHPTTMSRERVKKIEADFKALTVIAVDKVYTMLGKLYVFCEKIQDDTSKKDLLVSFIKASCQTRADGSVYYPDQLVVRRVYSGTLPSDPLREFLVDCYVYAGHSKWIGQDCKDILSPEFLYDFMVETYRVRPRPEDRSQIENTNYYLEKLKALEIREEEEKTEMRTEVE